MALFIDECKGDGRNIEDLFDDAGHAVEAFFGQRVQHVVAPQRSQPPFLVVRARHS